MSFEFILIYSLTVFVASIIPGPSMVLALTHGMKHGARRTVASALGNLTVTLLQAAVSIAGLGAVLVASESVFLLIKWAGAAYLVYTGVCLWREPASMIASCDESGSLPESSPWRMFLQGALVTAGNPKAIVFFTAIFPQFIDPGAAFLSQSAILLSTGGIIAFACFMLYALGGQKIIPLLSNTLMVKYINKMIGVTFIGVGIGLAAEIND